MEIGLAVVGRQVQKLDNVGVLEDAGGGITMHFAQRC